RGRRSSADSSPCRRASLPDGEFGRKFGQSMRRSVARTADAVVIGSGGFGAATAYFLAQRGQRVALVDKFGIASQTSPRAAGLASTIRATDMMTRLASRAADLLDGFEAETGRPLGAIRAGSVKIAREPEDVPIIERD